MSPMADPIPELHNAMLNNHNGPQISPSANKYYYQFEKNWHTLPFHANSDN